MSLPGGPAAISLRQATGADAALLAALGAATFRDAFGPFNRPEDLEAYVAVAFSPERLATELAAPGSRFLLAESGGVPAGYAQLVGGGPRHLELPGPLVEIRRFYVVRAWHGRGVAPRLMAAALDQAAEWGARTVWLGVWQENPRAIAFYRKCGFRIAGTQEFQLGTERQHDWIMVLDRPAAASSDPCSATKCASG